MTGTNDLQQLLDTFGSDLKSFIRDEVKRQVAESIPKMDLEEEEDAVVGELADGLSSHLVELEQLLSELQSDSRGKSMEQNVDELLAALESMSSINIGVEEKSEVKVDSVGENPLDSLMTFSNISDDQKFKNDSVDYYLDKLSDLNGGAVGSDNKQAAEESIGGGNPVVQKTGIAYAMDLLKQYKNKFSK